MACYLSAAWTFWALLYSVHPPLTKEILIQSVFDYLSSSANVSKLLLRQDLTSTTAKRNLQATNPTPRDITSLIPLVNDRSLELSWKYSQTMSWAEDWCNMELRDPLLSPQQHPNLRSSSTPAHHQDHNSQSMTRSRGTASKELTVSCYRAYLRLSSTRLRLLN